MIIGTGVDIVKVERFDKIAANPNSRFVFRVYTTREQEYLEGRSAQSYAGMFAAKEAVAKALGTGIRGFWPSDIEVLHDDLGKPFIVLHGNAKKLAKKAMRKRRFNRRKHCFSFFIQLSISHTTTDSIAFAVMSF